MVLEDGIIIEVKDDKVLVQPERSERCEGCAVEAYYRTEKSLRCQNRATNSAGDPGTGTRLVQLPPVRRAPDQSIGWNIQRKYPGIPVGLG